LFLVLIIKQLKHKKYKDVLRQWRRINYM